MKGVLQEFGYEVRRAGQLGSAGRAAFADNARVIVEAHYAQTRQSVAELKQKYAQPVFGTVEPFSLLERLAHCIDPTDTCLACVSQGVHVLQVLEAMQADGIDDRDMLLAALVHDLGKTLLLVGERPENVVCMNRAIGFFPPGSGLDNAVLQWNHDEFAYSRLKDFVPEPIAWLIRYHSIEIDRCLPLMDERDRTYTERYLRPFQRYDQGSKSRYRLPKGRLEDYRGLLEAALPRTLVF